MSEFKITDSPHFRWMPGMLARFQGRDARIVGIASGNRITSGTVAYVGSTEALNYAPYSFFEKHSQPDHNDPATVGCLLEQVREVWPNCTIEIFQDFSATVSDDRMRGIACEHTLGAALLAALEAAPEVDDEP